ncbi:MAG: FtsQ-type POTRA domain-containing protein [Alphaproteobacteria bacterium]|nr:FtsQ-type POTRA domain-containing protein [Alphaproteobacteria bacterium]HRW29768.1 FtsQ-type POTRA domain-containing protein [Emcibacteraceae bacterium]
MRALKENMLGPKKMAARRGEKEAISLRRRRIVKSVTRAVTATGICFSIIMSIYLWRSGMISVWLGTAEGKVQKTLVSAGLVVDVVKVAGEKYISEKQVLDAANITIGDALLTQDIDAVIERIEQLKWIKKATVRREFSGEILIRVYEHQPAALWQVDNKLWVVSDEGVQIDDENLENFAQLPMISGVGAEKVLGELITAVSSNADLFDRVETATWVGGRRWDLFLKNGIKIMLPEHGLAEAWQNLSEFEKQEQLLARNILAVDFRIKDKTVVRLTPEEAERRRLLAKTSGKGEKI